MDGVKSNSDITPLVSPQWLAENLVREDIVIIDIRPAGDGGGAPAYEAAHVPGAVHSDYAKDGWRAVKGMAIGLLPDAAHLASLFGRLGIAPGKHVVIVSAGTGISDFSAAARVYWTLKVAGHQKLSILNGGMRAWRRDPERPLEAGTLKPKSTQSYPITFARGLRAELADVERVIAQDDAVLLDSRSAAYFDGREQSPQAKRPGRLPRARLFDHIEAFDPETHELRPLAELQALFAYLPDEPIVNYCNTGHQAATNWFILSELLRKPNVSLYDGSMSQWTESPEREVEVGGGRPSSDLDGMTP